MRGPLVELARGDVKPSCSEEASLRYAERLYNPVVTIAGTIRVCPGCPRERISGHPW